MKNIANVKSALETQSAVYATPELIIDWNMNRYISSVANNTPPEEGVAGQVGGGFDIEIFPVESITEPLRPTKGINKARVGMSSISEDDPTTGVSNGRFYIADKDDEYKYWTSPRPSNALTGAIVDCKPQVVYSESVTANKIVVTLENTWASPKTFNIQTTTSAAPTEANWTTVATQATVPAGWRGTGQIILYWNGTSWTNNSRTDGPATVPVSTSIRGVRIVVTALEGGFKVTPDGSEIPSTYVEYVDGVRTTKNTDGKDSHFDLIEISARLEANITPYLISVDDTFDLGESSDLYPIGTVTTNVASIQLSNLYKNVSGDYVPGLFNVDNTNSPFHKYIDGNAEVRLSYLYRDDDDAVIGRVNQFVMYTGEWSGQTDDVVDVDLGDYSKFFNEGTTPAALWEGLTVPNVISRVLDSIGFNRYSIDRSADKVIEHTIPIYYSNPENSVWNTLDDLAKASQTAIYFDGNGVLQVKTRDFAFSPDDAPVWNFNAETNGSILSDIVSLDSQESFEPNHYKVIYQQTNWSKEVRGLPAMQKIWEPEGTVTLRSTQLIKTLEPGDTYFYITPSEAKLWPYEGTVNIEGEIIKYRGKQVVYFTGSGGTTKNTMISESADDDRERNNLTPWQYVHKNYHTGAFKIIERGAWNTDEAKHSVDLISGTSAYSVRQRRGGTFSANAKGLNHLKSESIMQVAPWSFTKYEDIINVTKGDTDDNPFFNYGTKFKFSPSTTKQYAGILINGQGNGHLDGYYIEFQPSKYLSGKLRTTRNELVIYSRVNGVDNRVGGTGTPLAIGENIWYELDVSIASSGANHRLAVTLNGKTVMTVTIGGSNKLTANGRFGVFARNDTRVNFEYLYAVAKEYQNDTDDFSFFDRVQRAYASQQFSREWVFGWKTNPWRIRKKTNDSKHRVNQLFMDEFGPYVHEIREFDVKFDPSPILHSQVYNTNDWSAICLGYKSNPFGGKFTMANTARTNAVLNGDDSLSFAGTGDSVNQVLTILGRALVIEEAEEIIAKNDDQIRIRGKIESEITSPWIQTESMAKDIVKWMEESFSYGNSNISLEVFGNPLVEVGDVVHVNYPLKHIDDDFFVIGTSSSFDGGLSTTLTLRRRGF